MTTATFFFATLLSALVGCAKHEPAPAPVPRLATPVADPLVGSAILDVLPGNSARWPKDLSSLFDALERVDQLQYLGSLIGTNYVVYSNAPSPTSAAEPRFLYQSSGGELYIGAIPRLDGNIELEFISWNRRKGLYDFGIVENFGSPNARALPSDRAACLQCHISGGPHYPSDDWPMTQVNLENQRAVLLALAENNKSYAPLAAVVRAQGKDDDAFDRPEVVKFFTEHPALLRWNGLNLNITGVEIPNADRRGSTSVRFFENGVVAGGIRAMVADYWHERKSDADRAQFVRDLLTMHLRRSTWHKPLAEHIKLSKEVAASPSHVPVLFNPKIPRGQRLKKSDFLTDALPFSEKEIDPPLLNSGTAPLYRRTSGLFGSGADQIDGLVDVYQVRTGRDIRKGEVDQKALEQITGDLLETPPFEELLAATVIPTPADVLVATNVGYRLLKQGWKPPPKKPAVPQKTGPLVVKEPTKQEKAQAAIKAYGVCLSCHRSYSGSLRFEFPVEDPKEWETRLKNIRPEEIPRLVRLRDAVLERLQDRESPMPPDDSAQAKAFSAPQRDAVVDYLKHRKIEAK